jgi:hypothetical protein
MILTPKEKAYSLIEQFKPYVTDSMITLGLFDFKLHYAINCALIAVREILNNDLNNEVIYYWGDVERELLIIYNENQKK